MELLVGVIGVIMIVLLGCIEIELSSIVAAINDNTIALSRKD